MQCLKNSLLSKKQKSMQNSELQKLALSFKSKTKTRDLSPLYEYAKKNNISEEELSRVIRYTGL